MTYVSIRSSNLGEAVSRGEFLPLRLTVTLAPESPGPVVLPATGVAHPWAVISTDLFNQEALLEPGESIALEVGVRFDRVGRSDRAEFRLQVNPVGWGVSELLPLPPEPLQVVPSLERAADVWLDRIYGLNEAVKVEFVIRNRSTSELQSVEIGFERPETIRCGRLHRSISSLLPGREERFDLVVAGDEIVVLLSASIEGYRVEQKRRLLVPSFGRTVRERPAFVFLEPRALAEDTVTITPDSSPDSPLPDRNGVFRVYGGKSRYTVSIVPKSSITADLILYPARGQVEVERQASTPRVWNFLLTVVDNPTVASVVRLDYDVRVGDTLLRGELHLSVQPTSLKHLTIAITGGFALTLKGVSALVPALLRSDPELNSIWEGLQERWFDAVQAFSILFIYGGLRAFNSLWTSSIES